MIEARNPSGLTIVFDDKQHTYTIKETGEQLTSCTRFIKSYFPEFDTETHAKRVAIDYEITLKEVKEVWEKLSKEASTFGTAVHKYAERYAKNETIPTVEFPMKSYCNAVRQVIDVIHNESEIVGIEKILFSDKLKIAGTVDLVAIKKDKIIIYDWKTSREIKEKDIFKVWKSENGLSFKASEPINHIEDCNFNHYSLQLNMYKKLLIEENYFPKFKEYKMMFIQVKKDDAKVFHVKDMSKEINEMVQRQTCE